MDRSPDTVNNEDISGHILIELNHYKQRYNWDCGLSCVLMVLSAEDRQHFLNHFNRICHEEGFRTSTWTIDLCYILKRYRVKHKFYTITLGVHPGYRKSCFYTNILTVDERRIEKRFQTALLYDLHVRKRSISMNELLEHLIDGPVILLTNARLLSCDICKANKLSNELRKCLPLPVPFQGHYVVLCGFDGNTQKVFYRNPSLCDRICAMSIEDLETARKCYGTDEDVILIYN